MPHEEGLYEERVDFPCPIAERAGLMSWNGKTSKP
jgi:hypothetical protein